MEDLALQFVSGLLKAMFLFLLASGLSLIFGVSRVLNITHGGFYALGAYLLLSLMRIHELGAAEFALAVIGIGLALGAAGAVYERLMLRPVYRAGMLFLALVTFGALLVIEELIRIVWGADLAAVGRPAGLDGGIALGSNRMPVYNLMLLAVGSAIGIALWLVVERTRFGLIIRAASMDREMLSVLGVDVPRAYTFTFAMGTSLAGVAGALAAPMVSLSPTMGSQIIIETFAVVVIGGLGSLPGSLIGALVVGELEAFGILVAPEIALPLLYLLMAVILVIRPTGLLGTADR
ncbi:MAG TPA: branched-chain amino acid ABC transporter permease [Xanthobacteraceae bacterium]|jgi:branched-subunit amino acid ABC-type transport system permease component